MPRPPIHWYVDGRGPAIVLVNGWTASGLVWPRTLVDQLATDHTVVRLDNRGSGWSRTAPHPFTIRDLADDVAGVLRVERIRQATVVGFSMGGLVAQELAISHPAVVRSLVLVATRPPAPFHATHDLTGFESALGPAGLRPTATHLSQLWGSFCAPGFADKHPQVIDEIVNAIVRRPTPRRSVLAQMRAVAAWGRGGRLARIEAPTDVVHGAVDSLMPVANAERLGGLIPHAHVTVLPDVGHLVPHEATTRLARLVEGAAA